METTTALIGTNEKYSHLESLRQKSDPIGDKVITSILESDEAFQINELYSTLIKNNDVVDD